MAATDIYELRWRTEDFGVVMNNSMLYVQQTAHGGAYANGAAALLGCVNDSADNILKYWRFVANPTAKVTCALAEKVLDNSATGAEQALQYDTAYTGTRVGSCAPSQSLALQLLTAQASGVAYKQRSLYIGGLAEDIFDGMHLAFTPYNNLKSNAAFLTAPECGATAESYFQAILPDDPDVGPSPYRLISRVNVPFYLHRKNSRRLRLCV